MKKSRMRTNASPRMGYGSSKLVCVLAVLALSACGKSSPGVSDIQPPLMDELNQCSLWTVDEVKKVDGIPGQDRYRVDFSAKLRIKGTPAEALQKYREHSKDPSWIGCHMVIGRLAGPDLSLWKEYDVTGAGEFVKSEKGWRLLGELGQYDFLPVPGQAESGRALLRPVEQTSAQAHPPAPVEKVFEPAPTEPPMSPCVAAKMTAYDEGRSKEIDEMGKAARARGEELQISAGPEGLMRQEALDKATADCK